ncbi:hypothetical protein ABZU32_14050 [Sphaerisporangium sp. NPDC005288]|uniref:hypothetical protein n=1 Tax=Sphaerisporangium sp. NPDC005288 TaxID=3155114 RepID=UPI0033BD174E
MKVTQNALIGVVVVALTAWSAFRVVSSLKEAGWRPVGVFAAATVVNIVVALCLALLLFRNHTVGQGDGGPDRARSPSQGQ